MMNQEMWDAVINKTYNLEFDWFGIDRIGQISAFSSFNSGFIPSQAILSLQKYSALEKIIKDLPKVSKAKLCTNCKGDFSDFVSYSEKGLFSYDYQDVHRQAKMNCYDLISQPEKPINITNVQGLDCLLEIIPIFDLVFNNNITFQELEVNLIKSL